jgi:hypothetical protein
MYFGFLLKNIGTSVIFTPFQTLIEHIPIINDIRKPISEINPKE